MAIIKDGAELEAGCLCYMPVKAMGTENTKCWLYENGLPGGWEEDLNTPD